MEQLTFETAFWKRVGVFVSLGLTHTTRRTSSQMLIIIFDELTLTYIYELPII